MSGKVLVPTLQLEQDMSLVLATIGNRSTQCPLPLKNNGSSVFHRQMKTEVSERR